MSVESYSRLDSLTVELSERIDRVCDQFEAAWREGRRPQVEDFLEDSPEPERTALWRELVSLEVDYRRRNRESVTLAEYERRFPDYSRFLKTIFDASADIGASKAACVERRHSATDYDEVAAERVEELPIGSVYSDYELLAKLGTGGMGLVYKARQRGADRIVAVKVIRPRVADELPPGKYKEWLERFQREARLTAALEHDAIIPIYEVGDADGQPFYAMRFVDGQSLAEMIRVGPIPDERAARHLERVARAVDFAHRHGILHRDLSRETF
jgi:serine/threonine-protein kinase